MTPTGRSTPPGDHRPDELRGRPGAGMVGLLLVAMVVGYEWFISGLAKVVRGDFAAGLSEELVEKSEGTAEWYASFVQRTVIPNGELCGGFPAPSTPGEHATTWQAACARATAIHNRRLPMYRWILVPLDGSTFAERALATATGLARRTGAVLELVHAHDPLHASAEVVTLEPAAGERVAALTHDRLVALARRLETHVGRPVVVTILRGPPVTSLLRHIDERHADIVVMASHGATGLSRLLLGSVATSLVRRAPVPVLLLHPGGFGSASLGEPPPEPVRAAAEAPLFRRILVPLDGSPLAELALEHALLVGEATPAPVRTDFTLLRVVVPHPLFLRQYPPAPVPVDLEATVREEAEARAYLDTLSATVRRRGFPVRADVLVEADIAAAIVAHADAHGHDLVAMATHGRGAARRLLLGSVADKVLRTVHTPVLLVRPSWRESGSSGPPVPEQHEATGGGRAPS